jgi:tetratricopeptide (TPR) repeat protein
MKTPTKLIAACSMMLFYYSASAQKAKVVSAYNYNKAYERDKDCSDLEKGIESIEPATTDEKTSTYAKTWYYGGNLYFNAAFAEDEACQAKFPKALNKALDYYIKSIKYNIEEEGANALDLEKPADQMKFMQFIQNKDTKYGDVSYMLDIMNQKFPYMANAFVNKGVDAFQSENYEDAKELSENSVLVNSLMGRFDSLGMYNAALASERLKQYDEALAYYSTLAQVGYGGPELFLYIANIHERNKDTTKKVEAIQSGLQKYPDDVNLIKEELSYLLASGQREEAFGKFDKAIMKDPKNASLYYNRALIYEEVDDMEKAAADYKKAMEVDPEFFDAAYNLGAMYYNEGVEWNNKASSYGLNETKKYDEATKKANEYFGKAKPALETAHEINPDDPYTMESLVKIYSIEGDEAKYTKMKAKLKGE